MSTPTTFLYKRQGATATTSSSSTPSPSSTGSSGDSDNSQTPFLFFIALGLGIVFTNLWVVLGLKYCCRNRRRRLALQQAGITDTRDSFEDIPIYLNPLFSSAGRRPIHDRRLMDISELNKRFPVIKYSTWQEEREQHGLSKEGGISSEAAAGKGKTINSGVVSGRIGADDAQDTNNPACSNSPCSTSQAGVVVGVGTGGLGVPSASIGASGSVSAEEDDGEVGVVGVGSTSTSTNANTSHNNSNSNSNNRPVGLPPPTPPASPPPHVTEGNKSNNSSRYDLQYLFDNEINDHNDNYSNDNDQRNNNDDDDNDDVHEPEPVQEDPGDVCSICLDTIEPDDDVRGLSCGHVFHGDCITRWLTTRRGSCPLCKTDFVKRRRASGAAGARVSIEVPPRAHTRGSNGDNNDGPPNSRGRAMWHSTYGALSRVFGGPPLESRHQAMRGRPILVPRNFVRIPYA